MQVGAERGDAAGGQQFSTVTVTVARTCRLPATPSVHTTDAGGKTVRTARPSSDVQASVVVKAGHRVTAVVHGPTTCNAPVTPYLVVIAASTTGAISIAVPLRSCALVVDHYRG